MDRLRATFDVLKMPLSPSSIHKTTFFSTVSKSKCVATPKKNRKIWRKSKVKMVSCTRHVCCRLVEMINFNSKLNRSVLRKKYFLFLHSYASRTKNHNIHDLRIYFCFVAFEIGRPARWRLWNIQKPGGELCGGGRCGWPTVAKWTKNGVCGLSVFKHMNRKNCLHNRKKKTKT